MDSNARSVRDLADDLEQRRRLGEPPPILLLGAGASARAGLAEMSGIYRAANLPRPQAADAFDRFCEYITGRTARERYLLLAQHLETADPFVVTPGYRALAALCAAGYFDVVLTANMDPLLDDALATAQLRRRDYLLIVNGMVRAELLGPMLDGHRPRLKVIKIHGDLFSRQMAWTPAEMAKYLDSIWADLWPAVRSRDFLIAGYSLRDKRVQDLVLRADGVLWYSHPREVPAHLRPLFKKRPARVRTLLGPSAGFEELFCELAKRLGAAPPLARAGRPAPPGRRADTGARVPWVAGPSSTPAGADGVRTLDDFMRAILGVARETGEVVMTGFAVAKPAVVVSDGYAGNTGVLNLKRISLVTSTGARLSSRSLGISTHPFGPLVIALPREFIMPRLHLYTGPLRAGMVVHVGVAAGNRRGLARGELKNTTERTVEVAPVGRIPHLIELNCTVAPGSSGAPVVDEQMRVIGFIVAGSSDVGHPTSFMYPARRWAASLGSDRAR